MTLTDIAIQNLRRRKGKTLFLLLTFILVVAISVTLNSLAKNMQADLQKSLTQYGANVVITPKSEQFTLSYGGLSVPGVNYEVKHLSAETLTLLKSYPDLMLNSIAPKIIGSASSTKNRYLIIGVDFPSEVKMKPWWHIDGRFPSEQEVLIGYGLAKQEHLAIGDTLELNRQIYSIVGIMQSTGGSEDNGVFTDFSTARWITGIDSWSMIELNTAQPANTAALLSKVLPEAKVSEISQLVQGTQENIDRFTSFSLLSSLILGLIAILIIFATTTGNINDRITEIGIFRAIGFRRQHILAIFIREILLISLAGGIIGYLLGILTSALIAPMVLQKSMSFAFHPFIALTAIGASVIIGIVSILFPAWLAINIDPVEALSSI
ncbi:ABC transporter permease [Desulfosporosinus hippei]|uniref:Putative ABC transport system permease protein n=1 Tax=Desulfosporosinus hippei DSM 8344 TaxID=1121419 RepID=A0A1G7TCE3_9FIRM|nr:FtsX-like permease family protein [Desulfosporosinus hippei]SDG32270.1 putative ABC transport system permease protein [Desulfosporosinus hippei DSM 8344]